MKKQEETKNKKIERCADRDCPIHNRLKTRGKSFYGYITKKFPRRIVIEFERINYVPKYERYEKKKTRIHARLPSCCEENVNVGDYVLVRECRPLSKIIHSVYLKTVTKANKENK
jgi:small subunit ribosomal protein S17